MRLTDRRTRRAPARRMLPVAALAALALAACTSDKASTASTVAAQSAPITTPTTTAPPTTTPPTAATSTSTTTSPPTTTTTTTVAATTTATPTPDRFAEPGPYPVGVTTVTLPKGPTVEVWYPAATPPDGTTGYDVRDFVPPDIRAALTADLPATFTYPGQRDAAVADGRYPLVVFSHGFSGFRTQSSFLTAHLASWGMIVAAPEHASRDLANVLAGTASGDQADAVDDVLRTIDLMAADDVADTAAADTGSDGSPSFAGHVDTERIGLVGHSAGGFTVASAAAADGRVDGYVSMASGGVVAGTPAPAVPALFLAGATDAVVPADGVSRPAFDAAAAPAWFVEIDATGHNGFDDLCTFGGGRGIIGVAEASGLGPALDNMPQLRTLGLDGCIAPAAPVEQAFPIIREATTSFLRFVFDEDAAAALGPELAAGQALGVSTAAH